MKLLPCRRHITISQKGEKGAFDLLVLKYQHKIVNLVMRYVRDPDQALDITQEAFLKAYRALPRFRGDSAFYTWLYRIAVNTAKNYLAAQRRRPLDVELDLQDPEQFDLHAKLRETDTPEGVTLSRELQSTVERAIEALPDDLRTAIVLRELELRGDCADDGVPGRHRALADFPRARRDRQENWCSGRLGPGFRGDPGAGRLVN